MFKVLLLAAVLSCAFCLSVRHGSYIYLQCLGSDEEYSCQDKEGNDMGKLLRQGSWISFTDPDHVNLETCEQVARAEGMC